MRLVLSWQLLWADSASLHKDGAVDRAGDSEHHAIDTSGKAWPSMVWVS